MARRPCRYRVSLISREAAKAMRSGFMATADRDSLDAGGEDVAEAEDKAAIKSRHGGRARWRGTNLSLAVCPNCSMPEISLAVITRVLDYPPNRRGAT